MTGEADGIVGGGDDSWWKVPAEPLTVAEITAVMRGWLDEAPSRDHLNRLGRSVAMLAAIPFELRREPGIIAAMCHVDAGEPMPPALARMVSARVAAYEAITGRVWT